MIRSALVLHQDSSSVSVLASRPAAVSIASLLVPVVLAHGQAPDAAADRLLERVRAALGTRPSEADAAGIFLEGEGEFVGVETSCRVELGSGGRFVRRLLGRVGLEDGFDGTTTWSVDHPGVLRHPQLEERELLLLFAWVWSGWWLDPSCPIDVVPHPATEQDARDVIELRLRGGLRTARLSLDAKSLPARLEVPGVVDVHALELGNWGERGGRMLPGTVTQIRGETPVSVMRFARWGDAHGEAGFLDQAPRSEEMAGFDAEVPAALEVRRSGTGHILVHPLVGGKDIGWFVFDTGAAISVIDPDTAEKLGMEAFGQATIGGAGSESHETSLREGGSLVLGPLALPRVVFLEYQLDGLGRGIGEEIVGVLGFDVLSRCVAVVDVRTPAIELHDPLGFELDGSWHELILYGRHPHVRARFEDEHDGLFRLDTGAGTNAVILHAPTVDHHGMLEGRKLADARIGGAGGTMLVKVGTLESFELAGHRFERPTTIFARPGSGALDDPYTEGTIGGGIFGEFVVVFDYSHRRIAFLNRPE